MNALCHCAGGRGLGAMSVDIGCPRSWTDASGAVHAFTQAEIDLCQARAAMESQPQSFTADAWGTLTSLENELASLFNNAYHSLLNLVHIPLPKFLADAVSAIADAIKKFLNWIFNILGPPVLELLGILALAYGAFKKLEESL